MADVSTPTLDEISNMPQGQEELMAHLYDRGYATPPPPPPAPSALVPDATVAPMTKPDRYAGAKNQNFSMPVSGDEGLLGGGGAPAAAPDLGTVSAGIGAQPAMGTLSPVHAWNAKNESVQPTFNLGAVSPAKTPAVMPSAAPGGELAAPEIGSAPAGGGTPAIPATPMAPLVAPTKKESAAAGKAEYAAGRPQVTAPVNTEAFYNQKQAQIEYDRAHPWGSPISAHPGRGGKILHTLGEIGQIAGGAIAPEVVANIPGSQMNMGAREATDVELANKAAERARLGGTAASENAARAATTAETVQKTQKEGLEQNLVQDAQGFVTGYKDPMGVIHSIDAPDTPQAIKDVAASTEAKTIKPSIEKMDNGDIVAVTPGRGGAPPTSNVVYHGDPKVETELTEKTIGGKEHKILIDKRTGKMIQDVGEFSKPVSAGSELARMKAGEDVVLAYDKNNKAFLVPRADVEAEGLSHPTKAQPGDIDKAKTHHVVLNTLQTQLNSVVDASKALDQNAFQRGIIAQALSHPSNSTADSLWRATVMSAASEPTKNYVQSVIALREAGLALPKEITGGSRVSEVQASALWAGMPSGASLNSKYAIKQARKFQQDIDRLRERAPQVRGQSMVDPDDAIASKGTEKQRTTNAPAGAAPAPPAGKVSVVDPQGTPHFVNKDKVDDFLKDPKYKGWKRGS